MSTLDDVIPILARLVGFRTITDGPNIDLIDWVQQLLVTAEFEVTRIPSPCSQKAGLLAKFGEGDGGVLYSAHSDVVPVAGQDWHADPFVLREVNARLIGRGTTDMKGFLACVLAKAQELRHQPPLKPFMISLSWDEEIGCRGIPHMIDKVIPVLGRPDLVLVGEPTEMQLCIGHKGKAAYKAICNGQAGHSALAPMFKNALHSAADLITTLRDIQTEVAAKGVRDEAYTVPYSTLHAGKLQGGVALNIVPERAELDFEIRYLAGDQPSDFIERLMSHCSSDVKIKQITQYPGLAANKDDPALRNLKPHLSTSDPIKVAFGTEAGFFAELGLNTIVCGPGSMTADGHQPNEGIARVQLEACQDLIARSDQLPSDGEHSQPV